MPLLAWRVMTTANDHAAFLLRLISTMLDGADVKPPQSQNDPLQDLLEPFDPMACRAVRVTTVYFIHGRPDERSMPSFQDLLLDPSLHLCQSPLPRLALIVEGAEEGARLPMEARTRLWKLPT